jgi:hypothetical protein
MVAGQPHMCGDQFYIVVNRMGSIVYEWWSFVLGSTIYERWSFVLGSTVYERWSFVLGSTVYEKWSFVLGSTVYEWWSVVLGSTVYEWWTTVWGQPYMSPSLQVEAYRCRERILLRDYQVLLSRAAVAGIDLSQQSTEVPHEDDGTAAHSPLQQVAASNSGTASAPTHLALCSLTERHPIHIHTSHGRVSSYCRAPSFEHIVGCRVRPPTSSILPTSSMQPCSHAAPYREITLYHVSSLSPSVAITVRNSILALRVMYQPL